MSDAMTCRVIQPYQRQYDAPIRVAQGDRVRVTKSDQWDDVHDWLWLWCIHGDGGDHNEGWVPDTYLTLNAQGDEATLNRDYSALEMTVSLDEVVKVLDRQHGWSWCENAYGEQGWVPDSCLVEMTG